MSYIYNLTDTWNAAGTTFAGIKMAVTNTASGASSMLLNLSVSGATTGSFTVDKNGNGAFSGALTLGTALSVANGGTGVTSITAGRIPYGNGASALSSSANLNFDGVTLGVGTTPSAWRTTEPATQISVAALSSYGSLTTSLWNNAYIDSAGDARRIVTGASSVYSQYNGLHIWSSVGSGSAGAVAPLTELMRIDASGNCLIGTSTAGASKLVVNDSSIQINTAKTPASATATGTTGQVCWDSGYIYVCTATNTWKRAAIASW